MPGKVFDTTFLRELRNAEQKAAPLDYQRIFVVVPSSLVVPQNISLIGLGQWRGCRLRHQHEYQRERGGHRSVRLSRCAAASYVRTASQEITRVTLLTRLISARVRVYLNKICCRSPRAGPAQSRQRRARARAAVGRRKLHCMILR